MEGENAREMENIEENVVTKGAKPADPMPKLTTGGTPPNVEDLGGPTPENYKPDDDSAKLKTPGTSLKQVKDIVNKGANASTALTFEASQQLRASVKQPYATTVFRQQKLKRNI